MYSVILFSSFLFVGCFIWYLIADTASVRRTAGILAILASLITCGLAIKLYPIHLGLDLQGGTEFLLQVQGNPTPEALDQASGVIRKRLDTLGTREITIQPESGNRLKIQIPGLKGDEIAAARDQLSRVAKLEFRLVPDEADQILQKAQANGGKLSFEDAQTYEILPLVEKDSAGKETRTQLVVNRHAEISGKHVIRAYRGISEFGQPEVDFQFDDIGTTEMADLCRNNPGKRMAIVLDREVRSAPGLPRDEEHYITNGSGRISGQNMSALDCEDLASVMQNPLENAITILEENSVDASLGADSIRSGWQAGLLALTLVVTFMVLYYRLSGIFSVVALAVNLVLLMGLLAQLHFTLTLPGIAGIVLTIGMAVDANVLIYERIRDELALGKPAASAIQTGFERAFSAIFDSNITTLIPALVLACLGTGPLRGFAVTLVLGIVANLFSALVVTRNAFDWILLIWPRPNLSMFQIIKAPRYNFLRYRYAGLALSLLILAGGVIAVGLRGNSLLGVDFKGGDAITLTYQQKIDVALLRADLVKNGVKDTVLQYASNSSALFLQTEEQQGEKAAALLAHDFPQAGFVNGAVAKVGSQVGGEMKQRALLALLAGLFGILLYAAVRFELSYAVAAAVGQLHDVLIALSIMAIYGSELTLPLVGALLTIAGYSINDKIVVFDRIREGVRLREKGNLGEVMNRSLNLTLARTIITGFTCLLATAALIFFGGPVIHDFSLTMFIGILSGIYSSHFISPGIAWWLDRHPRQAAPLTSGVVLKKKLAVNV